MPRAPAIPSGHAYLSVSTFRFGSVEIAATVTRDAAVADAWVRGLRASHPCGAPLVVGLDCKWNKQQRPGRGPAWMAPRAAVLQLCAGGGAGCLVLQLLYLGRVPEVLRAFLRDPRVRFVGVGVVGAAARLGADHGLVCAATVELAGPCDDYLGLAGGGGRLGLKEYAKEVLDLNVEKPDAVASSDWERRDLERGQIGCAVVDAYVSYRLGERVLLGR
ncbi:uncharacterized protein LOC120674626 [Panicum virgatum]|uniref:3'-5' exonuclease domain-containing protein n=1 Tax=Panicum virgatum TaxID=38727 RepID=A0A8T0RPF1_PANVG|nr:uncharacterized protein LOC120674626 [Panicum virgatum]KAG2588242.1 hypothetical protein PVAP13_5NG211700 [Panicum virgatum]